MNDSQFAHSRPRGKQSSESYDSDFSSIRSNYVDMEDRELAHAIKRLEKLDAEIRANEEVEAQVRTLKDRVEVARKSSLLAVSELNEKMDEVERGWDDAIVEEQKEIAKEILGLLKDLKAEDLSEADSRSRSISSSRSTASRSQSPVSSVHSSSMSRKIAHLNKKEREFAERAVEVKKDARQIGAMNRNLDSLNELERVVCSKLGRLQSARPGSGVYGTVELVENYKHSVENLAKAIRSLNGVSCLPAITNHDPITKTEIDKICSSMTEFMGRIKAQLSPNGPAESLPQTSVRVAQRPSARLPRPQSSSSAGVSSESGPSYESSRVVGRGIIDGGFAPRTRSAPSSVAASTALSIESHHG